MSETPTYVLVPGAWCGAWAWQDLIPLLDGPAVAVELPSTGVDAAILGDLHADAEAVRAAIDEVGGPVVLVGHSYGGMVVNEVADHPAIVHSVYLTAFWPPEPGASMFSILGSAPPWAVDNGDGSLSVTSDPELAREIMCADLDAERSAQLAAELRPHSLASFASGTTGRAHEHPTTYVVCDDDRAIPAPAQLGMAQGADHVVHLASGHFPQVTVAPQVARILAEVAVPGADG